jgi:hypothetical protein
VICREVGPRLISPHFAWLLLFTAKSLEAELLLQSQIEPAPLLSFAASKHRLNRRRIDPTSSLAYGKMETLTQRAALLRESIDKSKQVTDVVVSILGSFDNRLSALDSAMRPIQIRARAAALTAQPNLGLGRVLDLSEVAAQGSPPHAAVRDLR